MSKLNANHLEIHGKRRAYFSGLENQPLPGCGYSKGLVYGAAIAVGFTLQN